MNRWQSPRGGMAFGGFGMTPAVKGLLIANLAVFVLQTLTGGGISGRLSVIGEWLSFVPGLAIYKLQVWRFFTYMFLHGSLGHIAFNMLGLWIFGTQIEARWGQRTFLVYYFSCGLGAAVLYGLFNLAGLGSIIPMLGASGAIFGILLAYGMTFPDNVILVMFILPMKAKYAVMLFGLIELLSIPHGGSVAHLAHLGGMVTGFIFLRVTMGGARRGGARVSSGGAGGSGGSGGLGGAWRRFQTKRKMRVVRPERKPGGNGSTGDAKPRSPQQQKIDAILDKISREGLQSLSDEEQEILRRAGRK